MGQRLLKKYGDRLRTIYDAGSGRLRMIVGDDKRAVVGEIMGAAVPPDEAVTLFTGVDAVPFVQNPDLPDSDLVAAIHYYASTYAEKHNLEQMYGSFDETALLAMAVILEEKIDELLGETGHLVYAQEPGTRDSSDEISDTSSNEIDSDGIEMDNIRMIDKDNNSSASGSDESDSDDEIDTKIMLDE